VQMGEEVHAEMQPLSQVEDFDHAALKQPTRAAKRGPCCKVCGVSLLLILAWLVSLLIKHPNSDLWSREIMQSDIVEFLYYYLNAENRRTYDVVRKYYDAQRPLVLESARNFQALDYWVGDLHPTTYKMYYYDMVKLRFDSMLRRYLADPRSDDWLVEKDKCVMYSWFKRNRFPFSTTLREWHGLDLRLRGSAEHVADVIAADMRNVSGLGPVSYPCWFKFCHLTQGHSHSTKRVTDVDALNAGRSERQWLVDKWTERPTDFERPWAYAHDYLVSRIPPAIMLQANHPFDAEFKIMVVWGRAYIGYTNVHSENTHYWLFRDNTTREYTPELDSSHAAKIGEANSHWLFTEGHMEKIWRIAEGVTMAGGIDFLRIDFFLVRATGAVRLNENSLSSACNPVFRTECKFLSWAWAEPLVTREFQTFTTPLRTYELSVFDKVNPAPNLERVRTSLKGFMPMEG